MTAISGVLDNAIQHPDEPLPQASAIALCGGIAIFYATNAIISLRFGRPLRAVLGWAIPALLLTIGLAVATAVVDAALAIGGAVAVLVVIVATSEISNRRKLRADRPQ